LRAGIDAMGRLAAAGTSGDRSDWQQRLYGHPIVFSAAPDCSFLYSRLSYEYLYATICFLNRGGSTA
jgi:hypothetical protein